MHTPRKRRRDGAQATFRGGRSGVGEKEDAAFAMHETVLPRAIVAADEAPPKTCAYSHSSRCRRGVERPFRFSTQCVLMRIGHEFDGESTRVLHSPRTEAEAIGEPKPIQLLLLLGTRIRDAAEEHDVDGALAL